MPYPATNDLVTLDETKPVGSIETVSVLDDALRETRRTFKAVIMKEHSSTGEHTAGAIVTASLADNAVETAKIKDGAVTAAKLASGVLSGANLTAGTVDTTQLKDSGVTTAKIADANVTNTKLATDAVETAKIKAANVTAAKLGGATADGQIFVGKVDGTFALVSMSGGATMDATGKVTLGGFAVTMFSEQQVSGTDGGTFTSGAWRTRTLNTKDIDSASQGNVVANQITMNAGTYYVLARAPGYKVDQHRLRLQNVDDAVTILLGPATMAPAAASLQSDATLMGVFTIAASKKLELQHYSTATEATDGLGKAFSLAATNEIYAQITFIRVA